jgi:hypothetical protein
MDAPDNVMTGTARHVLLPAGQTDDRRHNISMTVDDGETRRRMKFRLTRYCLTSYCPFARRGVGIEPP